MSNISSNKASSSKKDLHNGDSRASTAAIASTSKNEDYQEVVPSKKIKKTIDSYSEKKFYGGFGYWDDTCYQQLCYAHGIQLAVVDMLYKKKPHKEVEQAATDESDECEGDEHLETENTEMNDGIGNYSGTNTSGLC
ncbi:hypothetical protein HHI36_003932 [Cryptolaemus montrouzieri]|uniref:Uncharacterized protein n=1 Tax=Cryptolaemus montrouzieri TaxID=559131 RepID=A0ABD2NPY2_9CUCU